MTLASVLRYLKQHLTHLAKSLLLVAVLLLISSCNSTSPVDQDTSGISKPAAPIVAPRPKVKQVDPPALIQELKSWLVTYAPQVEIDEPQADQIFDTTTINVVLRVQDLSIYKDETWNMGPHLELLLDNQSYGAIYDIEQPVILEDLSPGTHTLRVIAEHPWHESFKNAGSYAQVTFHIFAKTDENSPAVNQPLLTYVSPVGTYGAEPVLLDFYLTDAPLHEVAQDNPTITDWRIRYTLNGNSLTLKDWQSIYIEGLQPGKNWVQLTLVDDEDNPIKGVFNNTVRLINYEPNLNDTLAKIVRGELTLEEVGGIIDPTYEPPVPEESKTSEQSEDLILDEPETSEPEETVLLQEPLESDELEKETVEEQTVPDVLTDLENIVPETVETTEQSEAIGEFEQPQSDDGLGSAIEAETTETKKADSIDTLISSDSKPLDLTEQDITPPPTETNNPVSEQSDLEASNLETMEPALVIEPTVPSGADTNTESVEETSSATTVEPSEQLSEETNPDDTTSLTRQYFKRLYDYRDRVMNSPER
ncbi:MAG: hypothetical protein F6K11_00225 [Leptolyngbya sp. SIO3F4]|nr:hypothetical protein [Leptolyngbya sp. SIO3F4]